MTLKVINQLTYRLLLIDLNTEEGSHLKVIYDEGVYSDTHRKRTKDILLQWEELPTSVAYISDGKLMRWGDKAIETRNLDSATLDVVFMHKRV
ncbi:unnamed protein product [Rotaria sp. Silwood2]|nr:unnamed protein product [Rotaria sp. Silwood2]